MLVHTLLNETGSTVAAKTAVSLDVNKTRTGLCQIVESGSGTITATIQGSMDNSNFVDVHTFSSITTSDAAVVTLFPFMRVNVTAVASSPNVKVLIGE